MSKSIEVLGSILPVKDKSITQPDTDNQDKKIWGPFKRIPNVRRFSIVLSEFDPLFEKFGITKRFKPTLKYTPHHNNRLNRYMEHQLRRMMHADDVLF